MKKFKLKSYGVIILGFLIIIIMYILRPEERYIKCYGITDENYISANNSELNRYYYNTINGDDIVIIDIENNIIWE